MEQRNCALVTGGARGIGRAIAARLAARVRTLAVVDVPGADLAETQRLCEAAGANFLSIPLDITDGAALDARLNALLAEVGYVDILVNNAAIAPTDCGLARPFLAMPIEEWQRVLDVNLTGAMRVMRFLLPAMIDNRWGRIVNIASQVARQASAGAGTAYGTSKAGLVALTRIVALEMGQHGITVNCVAPGLTETELGSAFDFGAYAEGTPNRRMGQADDAAAAVEFLTREEALHITGAVIDVNGGKFMG